MYVSHFSGFFHIYIIAWILWFWTQTAGKKSWNFNQVFSRNFNFQSISKKCRTSEEYLQTNFPVTCFELTWRIFATQIFLRDPKNEPAIYYIQFYTYENCSRSRNVWRRVGVKMTLVWGLTSTPRISRDSSATIGLCHSVMSTRVIAGP